MELAEQLALLSKHGQDEMIIRTVHDAARRAEVRAVLTTNEAGAITWLCVMASAAMDFPDLGKKIIIDALESSELEGDSPFLRQLFALVKRDFCDEGEG